MKKTLLTVGLASAVLALVFFLPSAEPIRNAPHNTPLGGTIVADTFIDASTIKAAQEVYRGQTGKYLKVMHGGQLPITETGTVFQKLGITIPDNVRIETYTTPDNQLGYQICTETSTSTSCVNVGGNAREAWRTYVLPAPDRATSTINIAPLESLFSFAYPLAYAITTNVKSASTTRASSEYYSIADGSQVGLDGGSAMTFCTWARFGTFTGSEVHTLAAKGLSGDSSRQFRWSIRENAGSTLHVLQASSAGSSFDGDTTVTDTLLTPMTWYFFCVKFDGPNTDTLYYRNGAQVGATQNNAISTLFNGGQPFSIGAEAVGGTPANFLNGQVDDMRVWTRLLSDSEIAAIYADPCTDSLNGSNHSAQWLFDDDLQDYTVNNNDLTATGGAFSTSIPYTSSICPVVSAPMKSPPGSVFEGAGDFTGAGNFQ